MGLERVFGNGRGCDLNAALLRKESRLIFDTNSLSPNGLNAFFYLQVSYEPG